MNALLETGQAENDVYLHLGEGYSIEHLNEATLFLYINGKIAETPKAVSPEEILGIWKENLIRTFMNHY